MNGLIFPFKEFSDECEVLQKYAHSVLDPQTTYVLDRAKSALTGIQKSGSATRAVPWQIFPHEPLRTIVTKESQPDSQCKHRAHGEFSFVWEIRPLDEGPWRGRKFFVLEGLASTMTKVIEDDRVLASWQVDIGDKQSPGTHFHFQMNHFDEPPFPKSLDVPRLPAPLMSPFLAMEVAIGELFQDRWKRHSTKSTPHHNAWRNIQKNRMKAFLDWQIGCIDDFNGSPWMALKLAKPEPEMITRRTPK